MYTTLTLPHPIFVSPNQPTLLTSILPKYEEAAQQKEKCKRQNKELEQTSAVKSKFTFHVAYIFCLLFKVGVLAKRKKTKDALLQSEKGDGKSAWSFYSTNWDQRRKRISGLILFPKTLHPQKIVEECRPSCNWKAQRWNHDDVEKTTMWEFLWWITSPVEKTKVRVHFWGKTLFRPLFPHLK